MRRSVAAAVLLIASAVVGQDGPASALVRGRVVDPDGRPVAGAFVTVERWPADDLACGDPAYRAERRIVARQPTAPDGTFALHAPPAQQCRLRIDAPPHAVECCRGVWSGDHLEIALQSGASLEFDVQSASGQPSAARIGMWDARTFTELLEGRVPDSGSASLDRLPVGRVFVACIPRHHRVPPWENLRLEPGRTARVRMRGERGVQVEGRVIDGRTGAPIAAASVGFGRLLHDAVAADPDGGFQFRGGGGGSAAAIYARAPGYATAGARPPTADSGTAVLELKLFEAAIATGRVVDETGAPIADCYVAAIGSRRDGAVDALDWIATRTDELGTFELAGLNRHRLDHALLVRHDRRATRLIDFRTSTRGSERFDEIVLPRPRTLRGTVLRANGEPLENCIVTLMGDDVARRDRNGGVPLTPDPIPYLTRRFARSGSAGRFWFGDLAAGVYSLSVGGPTIARIVVDSDVDPDPIVVTR